MRSLSRSCSNAAKAGDRVPGRHVRRRAAVGEDDEHRDRLLLGVEVVEYHLGSSASRPLVLIPPDAVEEIQHGVVLVGRVSRRRVDQRLAPRAHRGRVVLHRLQFAAGDPLATDVKSFRRRRQRLRGLVGGPALGLSPTRRRQSAEQRQDHAHSRTHPSTRRRFVAHRKISGGSNVPFTALPPRTAVRADRESRGSADTSPSRTIALPRRRTRACSPAAAWDASFPPPSRRSVAD